MSSRNISELPQSSTTQKVFSILLIDDEADILTILKRSLELGGMITYGFTNPIMAVEHFKQNPNNYDLVVSDIRMPCMNGFEVARAIKKINPKIKIAFATSFDIKKSEFEKILPSTRIEAFITKPVKPTRFIEIIKDVLKS
jgi:CheY-like chemotaxis protein